MSVNWPVALNIAKEAKKRTNAFIVFGGPHPTIFAPEVVSEEAVDAVVVGDGDLSFPGLLDNVEKGEEKKVDGAIYKSGGRLIDGRPSNRVRDIDKLPVPDRRRLPFLDAYITGMATQYLFGYKALTVAASRGCPYNCSYCQPALREIHGETVRVRTAKNVIDEMEYLKNNYNIEAIWFVDDTFTFNKKWALPGLACDFSLN